MQGVDFLQHDVLSMYSNTADAVSHCTHTITGLILSFSSRLVVDHNQPVLMHLTIHGQQCTEMWVYL